MQRRVLTTLAALAATLVLASCGSESVETNVDNGPLKGETDPVVLRGAELFSERCSGCHTLGAAGTQGGATSIKDRERSDGPDFDLRAETKGAVLYALRNGGFSGAIMPQNIAVGEDAEAVAMFLCKYSGLKAAAPAGVQQVKPAAERCQEDTPPTPGRESNPTDQDSNAQPGDDQPTGSGVDDDSANQESGTG
jgi:mono/diheme cytochrome c family protein